jgi:hypothetical protein
LAAPGPPFYFREDQIPAIPCNTAFGTGTGCRTKVIKPGSPFNRPYAWLTWRLNHEEHTIPAQLAGTTETPPVMAEAGHALFMQHGLDASGFFSDAFE